MDETVRCPHCGAEMRRNAKACPACGSDEETGWARGGYQEDLGLPDEEEYEELAEREFGTERPRTARGAGWKAAVALGVAVIFLLLSLRVSC